MTNASLKSETSESSDMKSPKLLLFGNPLLDVTVQISNDELLKKYDIERNGQAEVSLDKLTNLFNDARARYRTFKYSLGGSCLNSSRILASLGQRDLTFYGAVGNDQNAKVVKEILKRGGVNACLQELKTRTGTCVCLCQGSDRSLVANIGAALNCEKSHVQENIEKLTQDPDYYYIEGFFIPNKMDICRYLNEKFSENPKTLFITNLNAPYIVKTFQKDITWMVQKADIIFGNRDEFEELATINGFQSMDDLISDLFGKYSKSHRQKVVIVTDGADPVIYMCGNKNGYESNTVDVPQVNIEDIVDTTGAGDSFVAGFLYAHMKGEDVKSCIEVGCKISAAVIRTIGCNLPKDVKF
ncbi:adenosine kinase [Chironomus tepperi]|uniref:adenosine kinase n=1 Tax=Chironomus tepperi TaxID=113505 RepID=UPI00391EEB49